MQNVNLCELIQKNINLKHISCSAKTYSLGFFAGAHAEKKRERNALLYIEGAIAMNIGKRKKVPLQTGDVLYLPTGANYTYTVEQDNTCIYVINFVLLDEEDEPILPFNEVTLLGSAQDEVIKEQFVACAHLFRTSTNRIALKSAALALFSGAVLLFASGKAPINIQPALDTIRNNINRELRIADLATMCGMSESTFRREFHRYAGVSPKQYILDRKIGKAKQMLRSGYYPIKEICMILGFYDDAYFSKIFKKATGQTPMQYTAQKSNG